MGDLVSEWVDRGRQRRAVYRALDFPRTVSQILAHGRTVAPKMTFQDVRHILRKLANLDAVMCITPHVQTGRVYVRTEFQLARTSVDWNLYAWTVRAKARSYVLTELAQERIGLLRHPATATGIKKRLRRDYPMSLNMTIDVLHELNKRGLVVVTSRLSRRDCKVYGLTSAGRNVVDVLREANDAPC